MQENIHSLARVYARKFFNFLVKRDIPISRVKAYSLYTHAMSKYLGLESHEYSLEIQKYGDVSIKAIQKFKCKKIDVDKLSLEEKIDFLRVCKVYFTVALQYYD